MRLDSKRDCALPCEASRMDKSCQNCCGFGRPRQRWRHCMRMSVSLCMRVKVCKWRRHNPGSITCSFNLTWKRSGRHFSCSIKRIKIFYVFFFFQSYCIGQMQNTNVFSLMGNAQEIHLKETVRKITVIYE